MSEPQELLSASGITFSYGRATVLDQVGFSLAAGEFAVVVGANGSGKSTLLKCLNGILHPAKGEIKLHGQPKAKLSQREVAKRIGYVPQSAPPNAFSVEEFVMMGVYPHLTPFSSPDQEDKAHVEEALQLSETVELRHRRLQELSGGERQRVYLAAALAQTADLLLLDEPTTFLDYRHQVALTSLLKRLHRSGKSVLAVTHDINFGLAVGQRILALREGRLTFDGPPEQFLGAPLEETFATEFHRLKLPPTGTPLVFPKQEEQ
ncbi:MAG: ABC transporter ATP-binding protein [Fimbriimonadaceae bacterium]